MRKIFSSAAILVLGSGAASTAHAQLFQLKGSDTLEEVTTQVINGCTALDGTALNLSMKYAGGGSGAGQNAMVGLTQQIAPMSRELNNAASCVASASELLIGLDGISVVAANPAGGNSESPTAASVCTDTISGGNRTMTVLYGGCTAGEISTGACVEDLTDPANPVDKYTFKSWKDVLALIYGGQNNGTGAKLLAGNIRNPDKISCGGAIRRTLLDNWAAIITDNAGVGNVSCRSTACKRLKHAFRRGDLSGTTDAFVGLVGLQAVPPNTTTFAGNVPTRDANATANPFCNAGERIMNKGDSDYMDMDPIRRIADSEAGGFNRQGKEQVSEAFWLPANPPSPHGGDVREIEDPTAAPANNKALVPLPDFSHPAAQNWSYDTVADLQLQRDSFLKSGGTNIGNARYGLGVVLPIEIPTNYNTAQQAFWVEPPSTTPVPCTPTKFAPVTPCTTCINVLCPDGIGPGCLLPVDTAVVGTPTAPNFNCFSDRSTPKPPTGATPPVDPRVYNLWVVDKTGHIIKDTYVNPSITLATARQNRLVSAFFRLHTGETTDFGATPTIPGNAVNGTPSTTKVCQNFDSTAQIGCLVKASPCSIGFAGREANDNLHAMSTQVEGVQVNTQNIKNFAAGVSPFYPIARGLWVNSVKGFTNVIDGAGPPADKELSLLACFGGTGDPAFLPTNPTSLVHVALGAHGFVPIDPTDVIVPGLTDCTSLP